MPNRFSSTIEDFKKILQGLSQVVSPSDEDTNRTRVHESGHAIVAWSSTYVRNISQISTVRHTHKGQSGFVHMHIDDLGTLDALWSEAAITLAGVAAEGIVVGSLRTLSAQKDLLHARDLAERLIRMGASPTETPWPSFTHSCKVDIAQMFVSKPTLPVSRILNLAYHKARQVITARRNACDRLIAELESTPTLREADITKLFGKRLIYELVPRTRPVFILPTP